MAVNREELISLILKFADVSKQSKEVYFNIMQNLEELSMDKETLKAILKEASERVSTKTLELLVSNPQGFQEQMETLHAFSSIAQLLMESLEELTPKQQKVDGLPAGEKVN